MLCRICYARVTKCFYPAVAAAAAAAAALQVLEKLDEEGCACVASLLKGLPYSSVFVVGQANSFVTREFASVDTVVKAGGCSTVEIGAAHVLPVQI
jgi:hypothetical protein